MCFTGHRHLPADTAELETRLDQCLRHLYRLGYRTFYCGAALGFDMLAAERTLYLRARCPEVRLVMVLPCADQDARWPERERNRHLYLTGAADERVVLAPGYYEGCMMVRNRWMVDRSAFCLCYLIAPKGGTVSTVTCAAREGLALLNLAIPEKCAAFLRLRTAPAGPEE
ncbi:MAG: DUF1273 family protein [Clostridia bacterium]|nr:DUF1273 family protein [Clostridia bacterium]